MPNEPIPNLVKDHQHGPWTPLVATFNDPLDKYPEVLDEILPTLTNSTELSTSMLRVMFGFTNITRKCEACGQVDFTVALGRAELPKEKS